MDDGRRMYETPRCGSHIGTSRDAEHRGYLRAPDARESPQGQAWSERGAGEPAVQGYLAVSVRVRYDGHQWGADTGDRRGMAQLHPVHQGLRSILPKQLRHNDPPQPHRGRWQPGGCKSNHRSRAFDVRRLVVELAAGYGGLQHRQMQRRFVLRSEVLLRLSRTVLTGKTKNLPPIFMNTMENWDKIFSEGRVFSPLSDLLLNDIIEKTGVTSGQVLDVGCGSGETAFTLTRRGFNYTGIDISEVAITLATKRNYATKAKFITGDFNNLVENVKGKFDLIFMKLTIAFVDNRPNFLKQVKSLLSDRGFAVVMTPVLIQDVDDYSPRLIKISVNKKDFEDELKEIYERVEAIHRSYFEKQGLEITYLLK